MDLSETKVLLERGGMILPVPRDDISEAIDGRALPHYAGHLDTVGVESLGRVLAEAASEARIEAVLYWDDGGDLILAHVVARELGVPLVRVYLVEGIVYTQGVVLRGSRALLLADAFRNENELRVLREIAVQHEASPVALAALVDTAQAADAGELAAYFGYRAPLESTAR